MKQNNYSFGLGRFHIRKYYNLYNIPMRKNCFLAVLSLILWINGNAQDIVKPFVKGDRVVFAGISDSIM